MIRLARLLERYEPQIRADLAEYYSSDVSALLSARRYRHVLALIDQLPRTARTPVAVLQDDELARDLPEFLFHAKPSDVEEATVDSREWDATVEMLASVYDAISVLIEVTSKSGSGKRPKPPKPLPRPRTAFDRERERRTADTQAQIIELVAPHAT